MNEVTGIVAGMIGALVAGGVRLFMYSQQRTLEQVKVHQTVQHAEIDAVRTRYHETMNELMKVRLQIHAANYASPAIAAAQGAASELIRQATKKKPATGNCAHCGAYVEKERCEYCGCKRQ